MSRMKERILMEEERQLRYYPGADSIDEEIQERVRRCICDLDNYGWEAQEQILTDMFRYFYKEGWADGMSEGTEHARQLQLHKEKYE